MQRRWRQLRRDGLRARVLRIADRYERRLAGAPVRLDLRRWPVGRRHRPRGSHAGHVPDLKRRLQRRITWIDANLPRLR